MILESEIIRTTDSPTRFDSVVAYYDDYLNLIVYHGRKNPGYPKEEGYEYASVRKNDAFMLARGLRIPMTDLPAFLTDEFGCDNPTINVEDVNTCFRAITDFILSRGLKYKMFFDNSPF